MITCDLSDEAKKHYIEHKIYKVAVVILMQQEKNGDLWDGASLQISLFIMFMW